MLPASALNTIAHNSVVRKTVFQKFSFSELKIEKVKFFTKSPSKIFCIRIFKVGGCLASCLIFKPFLMCKGTIYLKLKAKKKYS